MTVDELPVLRAYLATLDPPNLPAAQHIASTSVDDGITIAAFIDAVLAPAQLEVGLRWQTNHWTVAQEHAATAVTDAVLTGVSLRKASVPTARRTVVTGCVEGEWHTMPIRMLNEKLVADGHDVVFLGPSLSAQRLSHVVRQLDPVAVLASCTNPINLPGARRTIHAAHDAGLPVIVGGRAIDANGVRAAALGADATARDVADTASILADWADNRPDLAETNAVNSEQTELELPEPELVDDCLSELLQRQPLLHDMTWTQMARTREDIVYILQFCSAASVVTDPTVLDEFTVWLRDLLAPRGVTAATIKVSYEAIATVLGYRFPETVGMLAASAALI